MKARPASPALTTDPSRTNTATTSTEIPVSGPHTPPSAMVRVPRKLGRGKPGWPQRPGRRPPNTPTEIASSATPGTIHFTAPRPITSLPRTQERREGKEGRGPQIYHKRPYH